MFSQIKKHGSKIFEIRRKIPPLAYIFLSFAAVILIGSVLLVLPIATKTRESLPYIDALFTSISAVCVTGLSTINCGATLSLFGKIVLGVLIQIGGLGFVTIFSFLVLMILGKLSFSSFTLIKESLNQTSFKNLAKLLRFIIIFTFSSELIGALICLISFSKYYPIDEAIGISVFHAISSFNNAGFDILGGESLAMFKDDVLLNLVTCALIMVGGIGFLVIRDIFTKRRFKNFSVQTKIVLITNTVLLVFSFIIIECVQHESVSPLEVFFYSVNLRTAGFSTFNLKANLKNSSLIFSLIFMLIGASPLSTGGGIKTTTLYVIIMSIISFARGKRTIVFKREITPLIKIKAFMLCNFAIFMITVVVFAIFIFEGDRFDFIDILYEATSAFGTVGLSLGITSSLGTWSKLLLGFLMFFGRLGPVSILNIWNPHLNRTYKEEVSYLPTNIMIG